MKITSGEKKSFIREVLQYKAQYAMVFPSALLVVLFGIYPIIYVLCYSFTEYDGFNPANFIGLANYIRVFHDGSFWQTVLNTLQLGLGIPAIQLPLALLLAVLLNKKFKGRDAARAVIFVPNITSSAIMAIIFYFMFASYNGIVNGLLQKTGLILLPVEWFGSGLMAKIVIIIFCTWSGVGFYMVLFLAALQRIPTEVYESAKIDGANSRQTFFRITIPMMGKMFQIITALSILNALKLFDSVKALTNGGPGNSTEVITMYIFRYFFEMVGSAQQGYASAASIVATLLVCLVTVVYLFLTRKFDD